MNLEMVSALADERRRELNRQAGAPRPARSAGEPRGYARDTRAPGWRVPRYRVRWSRTTLAAIGTAGRRERSWVIVISATRGI